MSEQVWRISSHSGQGANDCVEVAVGAAQTNVRDSKARTSGELSLSADSWQAFIRDLSTQPGA
jgi:hypothetical protein